jgi:hypothetical protein
MADSRIFGLCLGLLAIVASVSGVFLDSLRLSILGVPIIEGKLENQEIYCIASSVAGFLALLIGLLARRSTILIDVVISLFVILGKHSLDLFP